MTVVQKPASGGGGSPTGAAGGDLAGTYPNPTIGAGKVTGAAIAAAIKDAAAGTASLRTLGTGGSQAAAGDHSHSLDGLSDVAAPSPSAGQALVFNGTNWAPASTSGTPVALDDLTDVDTSAAVDGYALVRRSGAYVFEAQSGGTSTTLNGLTDVTVTAPLDGDQLEYDASSTQWVNVPGSGGGVTWMVVPNLASDTKVFHNAMSITINTNTLTVTGATFQPGTAEVGKLICWKTGANTAELAQIKTRVSNTVVTLCNVGAPLSTYSAGATVANQPGAYGTDDQATLQAAVTSAKALRLPIGLKPGTRAFLSDDIDCTNFQGLRVEGLGGSAWISDSNGVMLGGQILFACKPTAMTILRAGNNGGSPNNDQVVHNGLQCSRVGFSDPTERKVHTAILTQFQTRTRLEKLHIVNMLVGWQHNSGSKDASWSSIRDSTTLNCKTHISFYNAVPVTTGGKEPTGAHANHIEDHIYMINPGETGLDWWGGQYGKHIGGKMDIDGAGSVGLRFRGGVAYASGGSPAWPAGTSPAAGKILVTGLVVEATGTAMDDTSQIVDVQGGAGAISFVGCHIGGGGASAGIGYAIGVNGSGVVQDIQIIGGSTINRGTDVWIGPLSRNTTIIGHGFGGNAKFLRVDAGSQGTLVSAPRFDIGSDPTLNATRIDVATPALTADQLTTRFWMDNIRWNNGFSAMPAFPTTPPLTWGGQGSVAYNSTTGGLWIKGASSWAAFSGGGGGGSVSRTLVVSRAGSMPATVTDGADFSVAVPEDMLLQSLEVVCKTAPAGAMAVQLRRSTNGGASFANVAGFTVTFTGGAKTATVSPTGVAVNAGDLLDFSITALGTGAANVAVQASGTT